MPIIPKNQIQIASYSSEDSKYPVENILNEDTNKTWRTKTPNETNATVILQLDAPKKISGIDIGSFNSAIIEVLVARSGGDGNNFRTLLPASVFMSPQEAQKPENKSNVRMFSVKDFLKPEADERWDRIKIVCTQPFSKQKVYGLSFVKLLTPGSEVETKGGVFGKFALREPSPDDIGSGNLFQRRKEPLENSPDTSIRSGKLPPKMCDISSLLAKKKDEKSYSLNDTVEQMKPRNRQSLYELTDSNNTKIDQTTSKRKLQEESTSMDKKKTDKPKHTETNKSKKRKLNEASTATKTEVKMNTRPFSQLMTDVTFTISGIQNPERAELRKKALEMGAKYKQDWDNSCTHLICAFINTPKFRQVKGKGKIVNRKWVEDCYQQRKRFPWRRYALDKSDGALRESEDEIEEQLEETANVGEEVSEFDASVDDVRDVGSDAEQEIERILNTNKTNTETVSDVYTVDTDDEPSYDPDSSNIELDNDLPTFFERKLFYIDDSVTTNAKRLLERYIVAFKGSCVPDPYEDVHFIIANIKPSDNNFSGKCIVVKPEWIIQCHNDKKLCKLNDFIFN